MEIGGGVQFTAGMNVTGIFSIPEAPTSITASRNSSLAVPGDVTSATVTFVAPTQPFGVDAQVSTYTATSTPESIVGTINQSTAGPITVSGLTSTTNYTFVVTATNRAGTSPNSITSNSIGSLPLNTVTPVLTGTTTVGQTLTTTSGTWTGSPTPTLAYQWQRAGVDISGATSSTHILVSSDAGNTIRCAITATNSTGAVTQNSNTTTAINWMPNNTVAPVVSGTTQVGYTLTTTDGTWTGYPTPILTYQWQRAGVNIGSGYATSSTYTLVSGDAGTVIRCVVTGTNVLGPISANSNATSAIVWQPINTIAPAITGTTTVGQTLSVSTGTWTGYPTPTFAYQWQRAGVNIASATNNTYTLVNTDAGNTIRCIVTATNTVDSVTQNSNTTTAINWMPANTVAPVVSGTTQVGYTLTTTNGTWTGYPTPTFTYQWQRAGVNIASANNSTYTLVGSDASYVIRCVVTGTNVLGPISANSNATSAIVWQPINTLAPAVTGTPVQGYTLTTTNGTWTGYPTPTFTYQWQSAGVDITGATSSTYILASSDLGNTIRCIVTATNSVTSVTANSNSTSIVSSTPVNTVAPAVTGTEAVGQVLSTTDGTWTGTPTPTFTYQWQRASVNISGETSATYTLVNADAGSTIRCVVTASNTATSLIGVVTANSNSTGIVTGPPVNYVTPAIIGTTVLGLDLTCTTGSWYGYPTLTFTFQWQRSGVDIASATNNTYTILAQDVSTSITCIVTATNAISTSTVTSNSVTPSIASYSVISDGGTGSRGSIFMANNSAYGLRNNLTIEFWIRLNTGSRNSLEVILSPSSLNNPAQFISIDSSNRIGIGPVYTPAGSGLGAKSVNSLTRDDSTWQHVAVVVSSGNLKLFVNGTLWTLTGTTTGWNTGSVTVSMTLFNYAGGGNYYLKGSLSNMRITKDTVLYTGAFTPPANPLTISTVGTTGANVYNGALSSTVVFLGLNTTNTNNDDSNYGVLTTNNPSFIRYSTSNPFTEIAPGEQVYTTSGTYTWIAPAYVTEISVVAVGGGGSGGPGHINGAFGGDGGYLAYRNNITVIPGSPYTIVVGAGGEAVNYIKNNGSNSSISLNSTAICLALGGGQGGSAGIAEQTSYAGGGGGTIGGGDTQYNGGGGGAGGYAGIGGVGGSLSSNQNGGIPASNSGGGRGGAYGNNVGATGGGGVGIYGKGLDGSGSGIGGSAGSGSTNGTKNVAPDAGVGGTGGNFGGGGGGGDWINSGGYALRGGAGGSGAVRIIWRGRRFYDSTRAFPSTLAETI